ncbi:hypothetical protein C8R44DRAFT_944034 [Mycena epipterygia]|nr:hypothetical protein C8R44DRAFT_944034 [Mycena epipterygia]
MTSLNEPNPNMAGDPPVYRLNGGPQFSSVSSYLDALYARAEEEEAERARLLLEKSQKTKKKRGHKPKPAPERATEIVGRGGGLASRDWSLEPDVSNPVGHSRDNELITERPRRSGRLLQKHPNNAIEAARTDILVVDNSLFLHSDCTIYSDHASTDAPRARPEYDHAHNSTLGDMVSCGNKRRRANVVPMPAQTPSIDESCADLNLFPALPFHATSQGVAAVNKRRRMNSEAPSSADDGGVDPSAAESSALDSTTGSNTNEDTYSVGLLLPPSLLRLVARLSPSPTPSETASVSTPLLCHTPVSGKQCMHCQQSRTSGLNHWYKQKGTGKIICQTCYCYEHKNHRRRPLRLVKRARTHSPSNSGVKPCSNCTTSAGTYLTKSKLNSAWRLCTACYLYERRTGRQRPQSLIARRAGQQPSKREGR